MNEFEKNIKLDAKLLYWGMNGGIDAIMEYGFATHLFEQASDVVERCLWFKNHKDEGYIKSVIAEVIKIEKTKKQKIIPASFC